jgi:hypothetical protein
MARKIVFETEVNSSGFHKGLAMMEARAAQAMTRQAERSNRINSMTASGYQPGRAGFTTGGVVGGAAQDQKHAKKMNLAVAGSMFTSVARDSAASLASGAPITQVIAQQAPQVLQALAFMNAGMLAFAATVSVVAVAAWYKLTEAIGQATFGSNKFLAQANYYEKRADDVRKIRYEMEDLTRAENEAAAAGLERAKKQSDSDAKVLESNRDFERRALEKKLAEDETNASEQTRQKADLELKFLREDLAKAQAKQLKETPEAIRLKNAIADKSRQPILETKAEMGIREVERRSLEEDLKAVMEIAADQLTVEVLDIQNKITQKEAEIAALYNKNGQFKSTATYAPGGDSLTSVGNFIGSARSKVEGTAMRQLEVLKLIEQNTRARGGSTSGYPPL